MRFGICTSIANAAAVRAAGWDYVEENVQNFLQGLVPDSQWKGDKVAAASIAGGGAPVLAACCLVPGDMKITGPEANMVKLREYLTNVAARAQKVGIRTLVFGSGGARNVPDGWDRAEAIRQIVEFARMAAGLAEEHGVLIVAEHLNRKECNVLNTVGEAEAIVREVDSPNFANLVDCYHFWVENENLDDLKNALPYIRHVHVSDLESRRPPGESGKSDFKPFFRVLKDGGYKGPISVESLGFDDIPAMGPRVLAVLKKQWEQA